MVFETQIKKYVWSLQRPVSRKVVIQNNKDWIHWVQKWDSWL